MGSYPAYKLLFLGFYCVLELRSLFYIKLRDSRWSKVSITQPGDWHLSPPPRFQSDILIICRTPQSLLELFVSLVINKWQAFPLSILMLQNHLQSVYFKLQLEYLHSKNVYLFSFLPLDSYAHFHRMNREITIRNQTAAGNKTIKSWNFNKRIRQPLSIICDFHISDKCITGTLLRHLCCKNIL